jgi:conjugative relaxase-like TrwC/TraI family protein
MLSIGKVAEGQHAYYEKLVAHGRDDYYSGKGEAPGEWMGAAAAGLGLEGTVEAERFNAMIAGLDPSDPDLERLLGGERKESTVAAYDLTFSAPKSLSVLYATADLAIARELVAAHDASVRAAIGYLEDEAVKVRRGRGGKVVQKGGGLLAAAYRHRMSRAEDPQLHTHVVTANIAQGPDGRWTGLWGTPLYKHAKAAGTLYQAHLRAEVRERLGLEWGPVRKGAADLVAIDEAVLKHFSQRRHAMERAAAASGIELGTKDQGSAVAIGTRDRKRDEIDTAVWREEVQARAAEHGLTEKAIERLIRDGEIRLATDELGRTTSRPTAPSDVGERLAGESGLCEMSNAFTAREAVAEVAASYQQGIRVRGAREHAAAFLQRPDVPMVAIDEETPAPEQKWTTAGLVAAEQRLITTALRRADSGTAVVDPARLRRTLANADRPLNAQQAAAVIAVARSGNGVDVIEALAGTGKTYTAGMIRRVYEDAGREVIGAAPTGRAVRELRDEAGIRADTIDSHLHAIDRYSDALPAGGVLLLDEAGMASTIQTEKLLQAAAEAGCKVIAIGDSGQLPSVRAGGWLGAVGDRLGRHNLDEVMRQRDAVERRMLGLLHDGASEPYVAWAQKEDRLTVHPKPLDAIVTARDHWAAAAEEHGQAGAVLIARNNSTRQALNSAARAWRFERGELSLADQLRYDGFDVAPGDRVICRRNDRSLDIDNGTRGTVTRVHPGRIELETDAGERRELPSDYVGKHMEHAYALTGHGMQGGTVEWAGVVATAHDLSRGWSYTALSRARGTTELHVQTVGVDQLSERSDIAPYDAPDDTTTERAIEQLIERMKVRDDEDLALDQLLLPDDREERPAPTPALVDATTTLVELHLQRGDVRRLQRELPTDLLDRLGRLEAEHERAVAQRAEFQDRLATLPDAPEPRRFRPVVDTVADQRASLTAAVVAADDHLHTLDEQRERVRAQLGVDPDAILARSAELADDAARLDATIQRAVERVAEIHVAEVPAWATDELGDRPAFGRPAEHWDHAVRTVARYRLSVEPAADLSTGLGEAPMGREGGDTYVQADATLQAARKVLRPRSDDTAPETHATPGRDDRSDTTR